MVRKSESVTLETDLTGFFFWLTWNVGSQRFRRSLAKGDKAIAEAEQIVRDLARAEGEGKMVRGDQVFLLPRVPEKT